MAAPASPDRTPDAAIAWSVAAVTLATVLLANLVPAAHRGGLPPAQDPACLEWTDACVVCSRQGEGVACSMPGIACTRGAQECTRR
ncbi:MAG: hypothetical protein K2X71_25340 [Methylobacterium sp.]|uniref:hypothetical protein n=1 Tax=Methylobacterium sp. TaxID=409 RepID=UPI0025857D44|nr:hypothetical protein [Methylobacterium sp.]MBY0299322.1 hypothetical protein [Methylobacterium sp.]